jgi:hypothetical protein
MRKRISLLFVALMLALTMSFGAVAAFAQPNCTGKPSDRPASCLTSTKGQEEPGGGPPGPGNFVGR